MKIKAWPFVLVLLGLWFQTALTISYLCIGMILKIGHVFMQDEGSSEEKLVTPSSSVLVMDCYHIATWPFYTLVVGIKESVKLISVGLFCVSTAFGMFFFLGTTTDVPTNVTDSYRKIVMSDNAIPLHIKAEINERIEDGFEYSDLVWSRNEVIKSCGTENEQISTSTYLLSTAMIGLFRMFPLFSNVLMSVGNSLDDLNCGINEITQD